MRAVTLETLRADFTEADYELVDLIDVIRNSYNKHGRQTDLFHSNITELLARLSTRTIALHYALTCYVMGVLRITFDPFQVVGWHEANSRCEEYLLNYEGDPHGEGRRWIEAATKALIADRYGLKAATLFKLSDGNIDPRVSA